MGKPEIFLFPFQQPINDFVFIIQLCLELNGTYGKPVGNQQKM